MVNAALYHMHVREGNDNLETAKLLFTVTAHLAAQNSGGCEGSSCTSYKTGKSIRFQLFDTAIKSRRFCNTLVHKNVSEYH